MALSSRSLLLYGFEITTQNNSLDFRAALAGPVKLATLNLGFYSLTGLCTEIARAMFAADGTNIYTCTADRTILGGLENRITISTSGGYLNLLFATGPRIATTIAPLIGFNLVDYGGNTTYTGSATAGTALIPDFIGYNYLSPDFQQKAFGQVNVSASGLKEAIVFARQLFVNVEYRYETKAKTIAEWKPFFQWAMLQRSFEITPEISSPSVFYDVTLDKSAMDGKGLGFKMAEMLPRFPNLYQTGPLMLRVNPT